MPSNEIFAENFAPSQWLSWPRSSIRVVDWNIDRGLQLRSIIDFLYDDLYGDAYGEGPMMRVGYRDYVRSLKDVVIAQLNHDTRLGPVPVPDAVRDLLSRARREGFLDQLDL